MSGTAREHVRNRPRTTGEHNKYLRLKALGNFGKQRHGAQRRRLQRGHNHIQLALQKKIIIISESNKRNQTQMNEKWILAKRPVRVAHQ
jgi:hypothetical protein